MERNDHHCNSGINKNPLITYAIFAFNQEAYIREAIDAAFSQTYSPLEIIISDDASADATPEIIRRMVAEYPGPHKVIVNINKKKPWYWGACQQGISDGLWGFFGSCCWRRCICS